MVMELKKRTITEIVATAILFSLVLSLIAVVIFSGSFTTPYIKAGLNEYHYDYSAIDSGASTDQSRTLPYAPGIYGNVPYSGTGPIITQRVIEDRQDAMGNHPVLAENPYAHNPTYAELNNFLRTDDTVKNKYVMPYFTCADFAAELQNHAEQQGLRCGYASLKFCGKQSGHAIDVFQTTDKGPVYVDTTGGKTLISRGLKPGDSYANLGIISDINEYW